MNLRVKLATCNVCAALHLRITNSLTLALECLVERHPVAITLSVHQHTIAVEKQGIWQARSAGNNIAPGSRGQLALATLGGLHSGCCSAAQHFFH